MKDHPSRARQTDDSRASTRSEAPHRGSARPLISPRRSLDGRLTLADECSGCSAVGDGVMPAPGSRGESTGERADGAAPVRGGSPMGCTGNRSSRCYRCKARCGRPGVLTKDLDANSQQEAASLRRALRNAAPRPSERIDVEMGRYRPSLKRPGANRPGATSSLTSRRATLNDTEPRLSSPTT
jgi:hypothetical protein